jgi:hypothetical protein
MPPEAPTHAWFVEGAAFGRRDRRVGEGRGDEGEDRLPGQVDRQLVARLTPRGTADTGEVLDGAVADRRTANLHPTPETLLDSHRALLHLFAAPAGAPADSGWGFKEVRLSAEHALYLHLLFPRARFVFLVRDPFDAYASYKSWRSWYRRWPDDQVRTAWTYGGLWAELAEGFLAEAATVGGILVGYEDLVSGGPAIAALEGRLGARVDEKVLAHRISGHDRGPDRLSRLERGVTPGGPARSREDSATRCVIPRATSGSVQGDRQRAS